MRYSLSTFAKKTVNNFLAFPDDVYINLLWNTEKLHLRKAAKKFYNF